MFTWSGTLRGQTSHLIAPLGTHGGNKSEEGCISGSHIVPPVQLEKKQGGGKAAAAPGHFSQSA